MGIRLRDQGFRDLYDEHRLCLLAVKLIWNPENIDAAAVMVTIASVLCACFRSCRSVWQKAQDSQMPA
jgi:hypothetical protein